MASERKRAKLARAASRLRAELAYWNTPEPKLRLGEDLVEAAKVRLASTIAATERHMGL